MTLINRDDIEPETIDHIIQGSCSCELDRKPRAWLCDFHTGYDEGVYHNRPTTDTP